ncbi:unnamed protein product, partial [Rotaria sordida]
MGAENSLIHRRNVDIIQPSEPENLELGESRANAPTVPVYDNADASRQRNSPATTATEISGKPRSKITNHQPIPSHQLLQNQRYIIGKVERSHVVPHMQLRRQAREIRDNEDEETIPNNYRQLSTDDYVMPVIWLDNEVRDSEENLKMQDELNVVTPSLKVFNNIEDCEDYIRKLATTDKLDEIHKHQQHENCRQPYYVYRGQQISSNEFERIAKSVDEFISMNSFLSTTLQKDVALAFVEHQQQNLSEDCQLVLFEIKIDPCLKTLPYANISELSALRGEKEVLFVPGTIFKIQNVHKDKNSDNIDIIQLELCSEEDPELCKIILHWTKQIETETNEASLGWLIMQTGHLDKAAKFYETLYKRLPHNDPLIVDCYYGLGNCNQNAGHYNEAIALHTDALKIAEEVRNDEKWFAKGYSSLADDYFLNNEMEKALESYQKALPIYISKYGEKHPDTVKCHTNLGKVYENMEEYELAEKSYQTAFNLTKSSKSKKDPFDLATSSINLARIFYLGRKFSEALPFYTKPLEVYQKKMRPNDPRIGKLHEDIGDVYRKWKKFHTAAISYHRAAEV